MSTLIGYWILFFCFAFELAMSVGLLKIVFDRLRMLSPLLYWWAQFAFLCQSAISCMSFLALKDPLQAWLGYPLTMWLLAGHSASMAQFLAWVVVFHSTRWREGGHAQDSLPVSSQ